MRRVLRFAIPTGTLAAIATLLAYTLARKEPGVTLVQAQTTARHGAHVDRVPRADDPRRAAHAFAAHVDLVDGGAVRRSRCRGGRRQTFFALDDPPLIVWLAGFGIAAIVWSFARLFVPGEQPVGPRARDPLFGSLGGRRRDDPASSPDETRSG